MNISQTNTVAEIAIGNPATTRIFERLGIDYCCGGNRTLAEACQVANIELDFLVKSITEATGLSSSEADGRDWRVESLTALAAHIVDAHHVYTRSELTRLTDLIKKVCDRHGANHPELIELQARFQALRQDLIPHMLKEEQVLFPYLRQLDQAVEAGAPKPEPFFGTVRNPVRMMEREHDAVGELLREIEMLTDNFSPPEDSCVSYKTLYNSLRDFEADLHQHIHLENNILFPRAVEFEQSVSPAASEGLSGDHSSGCFGA